MHVARTNRFTLPTTLLAGQSHVSRARDVLRSAHAIALGLLAAALLCGLSPVRASANAPPQTVSFNRDVRPILSDTCFKCHGPDKAQIKGNLSLHTREDAIAGRKSGAAIVPGKPDESEAYRRLVTSDPQKQMPPPDSGMALTPAQIRTLRAWIEQGAVYERHWSFNPPVTPPLPEVKRGGWARNPIDRFVLARLEQEGLSPAAEAEPATLLRRVSLDLTGLPPTPAEVDSFLNDPSPGAYERAVDRLLASPRYGERMAVTWLDAARYADTSGYQADWERHMWPWRDWVVRAFNANMPFDQFTVEQLAGDMLPDATTDQRLASGFNRNHRINDEGGIIPEEYAVEYVVDRVETTSAVWLGLTAGCARCHDHKYDPISQKEFYRLYAYFNNVPERGQDGRAGFATPFIRIPTPEQTAIVERREREAAAVARQLDADAPGAAARRAQWERDLAAALAARGADPWHAGEIAGVNAGSLELHPRPDGSLVAMNITGDTSTYTITLRNRDLDRVTAIRVEAMTDPSVPGGQLAPGDGNFLLNEFEVSLPGAGDDAAAGKAIGKGKRKGKGRAKATPGALKIRSAYADYEQADHPIAHAIDGKPATAWAVDGDFISGQRTAVFVLDEPLESAKDVELVVRLQQGKKELPKQLMTRVRVTLTDQPEPRLAPLDAVPLDVAAAVVLEPAKRTPEQAELLASYFRRQDPERASLSKQYVALRREAVDAAASGTPVMVMQEMTPRRDTYLLKRGLYDQPDTSEKLSPGVPAAVARPGQTAPRDRLELARWLVDPANPLTPRVTVNRFWQSLFGIGIVKTSEDFGLQGEWPSHPELLDWLATEFVRTGWDVKALHKLIVTSATYRQSSKLSPTLRERDPDNRLMARGSRFRLDAHAVRDNALAVSGLLGERLGGKPVKPYQPPGLWEELSFNNKTSVDEYKQDHGESLYRRTMYTFWKRTVPPPALAIFDAAGRETCTVRLGRTNTPLQALNLLNDVVYVEAARKLGERMLREGGVTPSDRLIHGFRLATARRPDAREQASLERALGRYVDRFKSDPDAAKSLLKFGESPADASLDPVELASYAAIGNVLLNLDETVTKE